MCTLVHHYCVHYRGITTLVQYCCVHYQNITTLVQHYCVHCQDTEDYDFIEYTIVVKLTPDMPDEHPSGTNTTSRTQSEHN